MTATASATVTAPEPPTKPHRARRIISMVLVVLAAILLPVATTAVWATRTVVNNDKFTDTVNVVISDPGVIGVVATRVTDETFDALAHSEVLQNLPPALTPVVSIVGGALRSRVDQAVENVLSSDQGQALLRGAIARTHAAAMKLLQGKGLFSNDALTVENGTITLDLLSLIRQVLRRLQDNGVIPASISIPAEGDPPGKLASAIGAKLPDDFGQIVVYQTDSPSFDGTLKQAQRALVILKRSVVLLVILALVIAVAAVLVAVDHRRAIYRVGLGVTIGTVVLIVVARRVAKAVPDVTATEGAHTIAAAFADALRSSLVRTLIVLALVAVAMAIIARTWDDLARLIAGHADVARIVVVAFALLILLVLGLGWGSVIFAVVVAGLGLLLVQRLVARSIEAATPDMS